jgi:hypothetical protein
MSSGIRHGTGDVIFPGGIPGMHGHGTIITGTIITGIHNIMPIFKWVTITDMPVITIIITTESGIIPAMSAKGSGTVVTEAVIPILNNGSRVKPGILVCNRKEITVSVKTVAL